MHKLWVINIHLFAAKMVLEKFARLRETEQTGEFRDWPVDVFWSKEARGDKACKNWERVFIKRNGLFSRQERTRPEKAAYDRVWWPSLKASTCQMLKLRQKERWEFYDIYGGCEKSLQRYRTLLKVHKIRYPERIYCDFFFFFVDDYIIDYMVIIEFTIQLLNHSRFNYILLTRHTPSLHIIPFIREIQNPSI